MSNYTKATDFAAKDALITGNPSKVIKGVDINTEFSAIETAIATKADSTALLATTGAALVGVDDRVTSLDFTTVQGLVNRIQGPNNATPVTIATPPGGYVQYGNSCAGGINALGAITGGTNNFAWGRNALQSVTNASANIAIGNDSLKTVTDGGNVIPAAGGTFFGQGWANIAIGDTALRDVTTGYENLMIGAISGQRLTTGYFNVSVGNNSQILNQTGVANTSVGAYVLTTATQSNNTAMGWAALEVQTTGSNSAFGYVAMNANTTGSLNSAFGANTLRLATTPAANCTFGLGTLENATGTVDSNSAFGTYAMGSTTGTPVQCGAFGLESLLNVTGNFNNGYGSQTLKALTSGTRNTALGHGAARAVVTGDNNTAVGYLALSTANAAATNNTAVGTNALLVTTADNNTALGSGALNSLTTGTNNTAIGFNAQAAAVGSSNSVTLGDTNISVIRAQVTSITAISDARDKTDVTPIDAGLAFVNTLNPVRFTWNMRDGSKVGVPDCGFIAQELKVAQEAAGSADWMKLVYEDNPDRLEASAGRLLPMLVKAIQEQQAMIVTLTSRVAALEA